jgi:hypothetical protein
MTLNVLKSAEKGSALTQAEHDANWTATENEVNGKIDTASAATSAQGAKADSAAQLTVNQTWTKAQRSTITVLADGATITPDFENALFSLTIGGNRTLANPTNIVAGQSGCIFITQDGTGSRTLAYGSYWDFVGGGAAPTLSTAAGSVDRLDYIVRTSTSIHATLSKGWA